MMLSYERQSSSFKIILTGDTIVNITEESLYNYFSPYVSRDLFEFAANFSLYEIPGHVLIILVIICLYSRDGMLMKKQVRQLLGVSFDRSIFLPSRTLVAIELSQIKKLIYKTAGEN